MVAVTVAVPARNAEGTLGRTLSAIAAQELDAPWEIVVVDDGSTDGTAALAESVEGVRVVRQQPSGPGAARDRAVAEARGTAIAFTDADCFPTPGWLAAGMRGLQSAELVQGRVLPDPAAAMGPFDRSLWIPHEVGLYETANLFVTRAAFERAGGFQDWLVPVAGKAMGEDVWFGWRARRSGARSAFCADALVHHAVFERGAREYVAERRRCEHFTDLALRIPELREHFFFARLFLSARTAAFDGAALAVLGAIARRSPVPLLAAFPYARIAARRSRRGGRRALPFVAAADLAADAVTAAALVRGSIRTRTPVL